ncbi:hypothetical protein VP01_2114g1 [Puccinia sorghi]|uniref:Uncharacterized protein n=1 Tax=Puccinia sorghi TaxID=27349 RepID=A0A0L6VBV2_9BASI|nr:hypothetical protein VP01_2114g1 [Puccinia sorghi]
MYVASFDTHRYNTCLEMLDLSRHFCCGPNLEGVMWGSNQNSATYAQVHRGLGTRQQRDS